jgi:hypothetical protein
MPIPKINPWWLMAPAAAGAIAAPLAYGLGRKTGIQESAPGSIMELIKKHIPEDIRHQVTPGNIAGTGIGSIIGAFIAQRMRQPVGGRPVPWTHKPQELLPGAAAGGAAGLILANLINQSTAPQRKLEAYA